MCRSNQSGVQLPEWLSWDSRRRKRLEKWVRRASTVASFWSENVFYVGYAIFGHRGGLSFGFEGKQN